MLPIGAAAPPFSLPNHRGETVTLASLLGHEPILLYFYPADFTPVCTRQACMYRDEPMIATAGLRIVGVSRQPPDSKQRFRMQLQLPFTLLSDESGMVMRSYKVLAWGLPLVQRIAYVIGPDQRISDRARGFFSLGPHRQLLERFMSRHTPATGAGPP